MENIDYTITIEAPREHVWNTMLSADTYKQWVKESWPDSFYEGSWEQGKEIRFIGPDGSGTLAHITDNKPNAHLRMEHIAALQKGGTRDTTSDMAKMWIGTIEEYTLTENQGKTTVDVHMEAPPEWKEEFDKGWPKALQTLKALAEKTGSAVHA